MAEPEKKYLTGGQNRTDMFPVTKTVGADGKAVYTVSTTLAYSFNNILDCSFEPQEDGTIKGTINQIADTEELDVFYDTYARNVGGTTAVLNEQTFEDGTKIGGTTSSSKELVMVNYGAQTVGTDGKFKITVAHVVIPNTSGAWKTKYGDPTSPTLEFVGVKSESDITVPTGCFVDKVTPEVVTIPVKRGWINKRMAKKVENAGG